MIVTDTKGFTRYGVLSCTTTLLQVVSSLANLCHITSVCFDSLQDEATDGVGFREFALIDNYHVYFCYLRMISAFLHSVRFM